MLKYSNELHKKKNIMNVNLIFTRFSLYDKNIWLLEYASKMDKINKMSKLVFKEFFPLYIESYENSDNDSLLILKV